MNKRAVVPVSEPAPEPLVNGKRLASATLYDIENELCFVVDTIEACVDKALLPELEERFEKLVAAQLRKADGICRILTQWEKMADLAADEIKRLQMRKKSYQGMITRLEASTQRAMELREVLEIEGDTNTLLLHESPRSVVILDERLIPRDYKRHIPESWEPDKPAIAKALKAGADVPGADLSEPSMHLVRR